MELLAEEIGFHDKECIQIFRKGGNLHGELQPCGNGKALEADESFDPLLLHKDCLERNKKVGSPQQIRNARTRYVVRR